MLAGLLQQAQNNWYVFIIIVFKPHTRLRISKTNPRVLQTKSITNIKRGDNSAPRLKGPDI